MTAPAHIFKTARRQLRKIRHRGAKSPKEIQLLASADQQRRDGLGWRYDGFSEFTDEGLFDLLRRVSIDLDPARFVEEAKAAGSPTALTVIWTRRATGEGRWRDLPMLAARELWRRLLPELRSAEVTADEVDELLELAEVSDDKPALWLRAGKKLIAACIVETADVDFFRAVARESGSDLVGWMQEAPAALMDTAHQDEAPELCRHFAMLVEPKNLLAERAELLARLGRREEALAQLEPLLAEFPADPVVLLKAGATWEALGDLAQAQPYYRRYTEAMKDPASAESRAAAAKQGVDLPPRPAPAIRTISFGQPALSNPFGQPKLEGALPDSPCPCGSGKPFRKCHLS